MITETIELIVKVKINYPNKTQKKEAIKIAKQSVTSRSVWGSVGCWVKSAKVYKKPLEIQK